MAASITRQLLSASTNGAPISVTATASPGTTIHTAPSSGTDEVWLWATNVSASTVVLTLEWGGSGTSYNIEFEISPDSTISVATGWPISGSASISAFVSGSAGDVNIIGYINRITS